MTNKTTTPQQSMDKPTITAIDWPVGRRFSVRTPSGSFARRSSTRWKVLINVGSSVRIRVACTQYYRLDRKWFPRTKNFNSFFSRYSQYCQQPHFADTSDLSPAWLWTISNHTVGRSVFDSAGTLAH